MQVASCSNKEIEGAISKRLFILYEYKDFYNIEEIGNGAYGKVYRANWKNSVIAYKSFNLNNTDNVKGILNEVIYVSSICSNSKSF
jgi:hypothetical protein